MVVLWIVLVYFCLFLEVKVLDDVIDSKVFPPLLSSKEHLLRLH